MTGNDTGRDVDGMDYSGNYFGWRGYLTVGPYQAFLAFGWRKRPDLSDTDIEGGGGCDE